MAIRKSMDEEIVVSGDRDQWLKKCEESLEKEGFNKIDINNSLYQIKGNYKKLTIWGEILVTLKPYSGNETTIVIKSTSNVDNIFALFKSPNKTIIEKFKEGL